jgi:hypothetical protein
MQDETTDKADEKRERDKLPDEASSKDEDSRGNPGSEGFRAARTENDDRSLEELADDEDEQV